MNEEMSMADLMDQYESIKEIHTGDIVEGVVLSVNPEEVIVNMNYMADGVLPKEEIEGSTTEGIAVGDTISVYILKNNDGEGNVLLSLKQAESHLVWDELAKFQKADKAFTVKIKEAVKGGVVGDYKSARVFIPASQLSIHYVEDVKPYIGQKLEVVLVEYDADKKKVVASHKTLEKAELEKTRIDKLSRISVGDALSGQVVRLANYGAFVDLGGVDGLIHVSQMSWRRVKHPSEVLSEGDVVDVIVTNVDRESEKIGLKLASVQENPWDSILLNYTVNDIVWGTVTRFTNFGVFVAIEEGVEGLIHISELASDHVSKPQDVVAIDEEIEVMILSIDVETQRIALSRKAVIALDEADYEPYEEEEVSQTTMSDLFGDKLKNLKL